MIKRIEIILGCMFSGKSTELLRRLSRYQAINIDTLLINHLFDTRTGNSIKTHDNLEKKALKVKTLMEIVNTDEYLNSNVIGIDEAQFFTDLKEFVLYSEKNKTIIIAGLDGDSNREPFGEILNCIPLCDEVVKLTAMDMMKNDGTKAIFSLKKKIKNELNISNKNIDIGSEDKYLAVSREIFLQTKDKE
tara:strand:- start:4317 stop:4886 length:570 start_codon:yes stop_codon:yes gene_type:complete